MNKNLLLTLICLVFFSVTVLGQKNPKSNGNDGKGRTNLLLPHGNIGIGTLNPAARLEVIGNVRISDALQVKEIEVANLSATSLSISEDILVGRNILVDGNIGVGVSNPTERLEIGGNLRVSQQIFAEGMETGTLLGESGAFGRQLDVGDLFLVDGLTGLGVATPAERLEVAGNIKATGDFLGQQLLVEEGAFNGNVNIGQNLSVSGTSVFSGEVSAGNLLVSESLQSGSFQAGSGIVEGPFVVGGSTSVGGSLGIGIEAPAEKLEVVGNIKATGGFLGQNLAVEQGDFAGDLLVGQDLSVTGSSAFRGEVAMTALKITDSLYSKVIDSERAAINGSFSVGGPVSLDSTLLVKGTLGIGTDKVEGYMLSVKGKIRAGDDIRVYPSVEWADYVFEDHYHLPSLQEVENFILTHGHLSEIPSAINVKKEGIELGEMNAKLLQKIEELTLYTIAQEKELVAQQEKFTQKDEEIKALRSELEELKTLVEELAAKD